MRNQYSTDADALYGVKSKNLHIWLILVGIALFLICAVVWAFTAQVRTYVNTSGFSEENTVICYLSAKDVNRIETGMAVVVNDRYSGTVSIISDVPVSRAEVEGSLVGDFTDYASASMNLSEWNYRVVVSLDLPMDDGKLCKISVIADTARPIDYLGA